MALRALTRNANGDEARKAALAQDTYLERARRRGKSAARPGDKGDEFVEIGRLHRVFERTVLRRSRAGA